MPILIVLDWPLSQGCYQQEDLIRLSNALLLSSFRPSSFLFLLLTGLVFGRGQIELILRKFYDVNELSVPAFSLGQ